MSELVVRTFFNGAKVVDFSDVQSWQKVGESDANVFLNGVPVREPRHAHSRSPEPPDARTAQEN